MPLTEAVGTRDGNATSSCFQILPQRSEVVKISPTPLQSQRRNVSPSVNTLAPTQVYHCPFYFFGSGGRLHHHGPRRRMVVDGISSLPVPLCCLLFARTAFVDRGDINPADEVRVACGAFPFGRALQQGAAVLPAQAAPPWRRRCCAAQSCLRRGIQTPAASPPGACSGRPLAEHE